MWPGLLYYPLPSYPVLSTQGHEYSQCCWPVVVALRGALLRELTCCGDVRRWHAGLSRGADRRNTRTRRAQAAGGQTAGRSPWVGCARVRIGRNAGSCWHCYSRRVGRKLYKMALDSQKRQMNCIGYFLIYRVNSCLILDTSNCLESPHVLGSDDVFMESLGTVKSCFSFFFFATATSSRVQLTKAPPPQFRSG